MVIVGITGGIGHGKTTFAAALASCAPTSRSYESSSIIIDVANDWRAALTSHPKRDDIIAINGWLSRLPGILAKHTHTQTTFAEIELTLQRLSDHPEYYEKLFGYLETMLSKPELQDVHITTQNKAAFRSLLQWLGGYLAKSVDPGIWYDEIVRRIKNSPPVDIAVVGGVRFPADAERIRDAGGVVIEILRQSHTAKDESDLTERERTLITADITVHNDSDLNALTICATRVYDDLQGGKYQSLYYASKH